MMTRDPHRPGRHGRLLRALGALLLVGGCYALVAMRGLTTEGHAMTDQLDARIAARMAALYDAAASDVNAMTARAARELGRTPESRSAQWRETRAAALSREIEQRLRALGVQTTGVLAMSKGSIASALQRAETELRDIGYSTAGPGVIDQRVGFAVVDDRAVEIIAQDTEARLAARAAPDLERSAASHARSAVQLFRSLSPSDGNVAGGGEVAVNEAVARGLINGNTTITDRAIRARYADPDAPQIEGVRKLGNKIIEVGRAQMSVRQYAAVVTRTRLREATETAHDQRLLSVGLRLGQIFGSNSRNFCTAFVGLVVSLDGSPAVIDGVTFPSKSSLPNGGPPFHPLCSKNTVAFDAELVRPERVQQAMRAVRVFERRRETGRLLADVT